MGFRHSSDTGMNYRCACSPKWLGMMGQPDTWIAETVTGNRYFTGIFDVSSAAETRANAGWRSSTITVR